MRRSTILVGGAVALVTASAFAFGGRSRDRELRYEPVTVDADQAALTLAGMKPPKRSRPVIAVVAQVEGTETTDLLVPYGVLAASESAEVLIVAPEARTIQLTPALRIEPHTTIDAFDGRFPEGADYVVVPKIRDAADPTITRWIRSQSAAGATIVGICSGVKTVAAAGLLDGRRSTGHWYDLEELRAAHPSMEWVPDRRYVVDRGVMTTTGVSASLPASLALVEAIAGRERAERVAAEAGVSSWDASHDSSAFSLDSDTYALALGNRYRFWTHETFAIRLDPGVDEITLAFVADAWSRTERSKALTIASDESIPTRRGVVLRPDLASALDGYEPLELPDAGQQALPTSLDRIAARYGSPTAAYVALQLEFPWSTTTKLQERNTP